LSQAIGVTPSGRIHLIYRSSTRPIGSFTTGQSITLIYDFSAKEQLKDFEVGDSKPSLAKGVLTVGPGENVRHVVRFKTLTVTGQVQIGSLSGRHFKTSEKLWVGGSDKDVYILNENSTKEAEKYVSAAFAPGKALTPFEFSVSPARLALRIGDARIGLATKTASAGHLELLGGTSGGNGYGKLVIQGQIDPEWAKEFFKE
jgi:ethanolamine utilization microcompartment shell protein EutS